MFQGTLKPYQVEVAQGGTFRLEVAFHNPLLEVGEVASSAPLDDVWTHRIDTPR